MQAAARTEADGKVGTPDDVKGPANRIGQRAVLLPTGQPRLGIHMPTPRRRKGHTNGQHWARADLPAQVEKALHHRHQTDRSLRRARDEGVRKQFLRVGARFRFLGQTAPDEIAARTVVGEAAKRAAQNQQAEQ